MRGPAVTQAVRRWWWASAAVVVIAIAMLALLVATSGKPADRSGSPARAATTPASARDSSSPSPSRAEPSPSLQSRQRRASASARPRVSQTLPASPDAGRPHAKPAAFKLAVAASRFVTVRVAKVEAITSKATQPGELSRPALRITIAARNSSRKATSIRSALVNAYYGPKSTPAVAVGKPGAKWFPSQIPAHGTAEGVYIFNIPVASRGDVTLEVDLATGLKIVTFHGVVHASR